MTTKHVVKYIVKKKLSHLQHRIHGSIIYTSVGTSLITVMANNETHRIVQIQIQKHSDLDQKYQ